MTVRHDVLDPSRIVARGAAELGITLPHTTVSSLLKLLEMVSDWNHKVNLTSVTEPAEMAVVHVLDSITLFTVLPKKNSASLTSGAGPVSPA